ncbi:hypothetical protein I4F81_005252 [Pyropia yezoensis]|uniref:Uncharacterized protein n=1 Tax=Pyropia yezoensis TaxID=2788 RepID=A0ACC3BXA8_PYRYE|nr:hypothetical protein I4F81_005252 [Neopyropia yezoensis]
MAGARGRVRGARQPRPRRPPPPPLPPRTVADIGVTTTTTTTARSAAAGPSRPVGVAGRPPRWRGRRLPGRRGGDGGGDGGGHRSPSAPHLWRHNFGRICTLPRSRGGRRARANRRLWAAGPPPARLPSHPRARAVGRAPSASLCASRASRGLAGVAFNTVGRPGRLVHAPLPPCCPPARLAPLPAPAPLLFALPVATRAEWPAPPRAPLLAPAARFPVGVEGGEWRRGE